MLFNLKKVNRAALFYGVDNLDDADAIGVRLLKFSQDS